MPFADQQALYMFMADYQRSTRRTGSPVMVGVPESLALSSVTAGEFHCSSVRYMCIIAVNGCATTSAATYHCCTRELSVQCYCK
jgi:hypothetical protein